MVTQAVFCLCRGVAVNTTRKSMLKVTDNSGMLHTMEFATAVICKRPR
jgi:hypothetical protein